MSSGLGAGGLGGWAGTGTVAPTSSRTSWLPSGAVVLSPCSTLKSPGRSFFPSTDSWATPASEARSLVGPGPVHFSELPSAGTKSHCCNGSGSRGSRALSCYLLPSLKHSESCICVMLATVFFQSTSLLPEDTGEVKRAKFNHIIATLHMVPGPYPQQRRLRI